MTRQTPPWWRHVVLSYPCHTCGAPAGQDCTTRLGRRSPTPHASRGRAADRCIRCGVLLENDHDAADVLCPHCALIRSLETERATHHQRQQTDQ